MKYQIIAAILLTSAVFAQAQKFTLRQSVELGLKNSKDIRISQSKLTAAEARSQEAGSQLLPQLKMGASYTRLSNVPPFEVKIPVMPAPIKISDVILNNYNLRLSLQQPLFTGFRLTSLKSAADLNGKAAYEELQKDINEAAFRIQSAFWQYYKAAQLAALLNKNLAQNAKHLEDTKNNLQNGLVTQNDVLKLQVQLANTKLQQIEAENNLDIAKVAFNQALNIPLDSQTDIDVSDIITQDQAPSVKGFQYSEIIKEAKESRSELKSLQYRVEAARKNAGAARSGWMPSVFLNANYYYNNPNSRYQPPKDQFNDSWDLGVSLSWDLWNWGYTSAQTAQAEENTIQTETSLSQLNDAVEIEVYSNYLTYQRASERIQVSRQSVEQAKENYRIINDKYNVQLATSTDLIDAETAVLQMETNYNNAVVDFELAQTRLEKSIGRKIY
ncbi:MAG: TolC family protein [Syntrophothermus sp.]